MADVPTESAGHQPIPVVRLGVAAGTVVGQDPFTAGPALPEVSAGLAISSRNQRLTADDRRAAVCLAQALQLGAGAVVKGERNSERLVALATRRIAAASAARLEYLHIVDPLTLEPLDEVDRPAIMVVAAWFGDVRLIDNLPLSP